MGHLPAGHPPLPARAALMKPTWAAKEKGLVAGIFIGLLEHVWFLCPGSETVFLSQARNTEAWLALKGETHLKIPMCPGLRMI